MPTCNHVLRFLQPAISQRLQETVFKDLPVGVGEYLTDGRRIARFEGFTLIYRLRHQTSNAVAFERDIDAFPALLLRHATTVRGTTKWAGAPQQATEWSQWRAADPADPLLVRTLAGIAEAAKPKPVREYHGRLIRFDAYSGDGNAP